MSRPHLQTLRRPGGAVPWVRRRLDAVPRGVRWAAAILLALVLLAVVAAAFVDEPLRRWMEAEINRRLQGYSVTIGRLDFHPIGASLDLEELVLVQDARPDPPVARFPKLSASVEWKALLFGRLVANFSLDDPVVYADRTHLQREARDETPVHKRGWQEAVQAIYPLKVNLLRIRNGRLTYVDRADLPPLELSRVNVRAANIRNVRSRDREYPSEIHVDAVVFEQGGVVVDGHADFLKVPHAGVTGTVRLERIDLTRFAPIAARYRLKLTGGTVTAAGRVEYAPTIKVVELDEVTVHRLVADYRYTTRAETPEKRAARKTAETAERVSNDPRILVKVARLRLTGELGVVNQRQTPPYRVYFSDIDLTAENFSNHRTEGVATARATARFMGSGRTAVAARFRPETNGPDFDLDLALEDTDLRRMNDLLRAHARVDVVDGLFSAYSEIRVHDRMVEGYVKPLFRRVDVYDPRQDREKGALRKLYEAIVGGVAKLLQNKTERREVATVADLSGRLGDADTDTVQVILRLVQNAFFKAILPGFEAELGRPSRSARTT